MSTIQGPLTVAENSEISWTDATYNPWIGCTKVGPGCDHCYAEADFDLRKGRVKWGFGNPRSRTKTERQPHTWNNQHREFFAEHGRRRRVFSASLADIFDNEVPPLWRNDFWNTVSQTPCLDWYIVTKRISNVEKMLPTPWAQDLFGHIVLLVTVVNQDEADRDVPRLLALKAKYPWLRIGFSIEPMLGPIDLEYPVSMYPDGPPMCCSGFECGCMGRPIERPLLHDLSWIICGGESGPHARPMHPDWARSLRDQCAAASVPFHFKQWGEWAPDDGACAMQSKEFDRLVGARTAFDGDSMVYRLGKKNAGRKLDGVEHNGFPEAAQ